MKKQIIFLMFIIFALFSVPALAADDPAAFSVTVPSFLPVVIGADGGVSVASDARIVNNGTLPVKVDSVSVEPQNGWQLDAWGMDYSAVKVDSKQFAMQFGGASVPVSGTVDVSGYAAISGGGSMELSYDTRIPAQSVNLNETIAKVVFTVSWDGRGPLSALTVTRSPYYTEYYEGDAFNTAWLRISAAYADGSSRTVTGWTITDGASLNAGQTSVTVSYTEDGITKTVQVPITVTPLAYAILYSNGEMVFQRGNIPDAARTVTATYTGFETESYYPLYSPYRINTPWYDQRESIKKITFKDEITPRYISYWFHGCSNLTMLNNISSLNTSKVYSMASTFQNCSSLFSINLSDWDTSNVRNMNSMFAGCSNLAIADLSGWDTSNVTSMSAMFSSCSSLTSVGLSAWDTSNVTTINNMFMGCGNLASLDLSKWNTAKVTDMSYVFWNCTALSRLSISSWDTSNVTTMCYMFGNTDSLVSLDLHNWNTGKVTEMSYLFNGCDGLSSLNISGWNTSSVTKMSMMFGYCKNLASLDVSSFDTSNVMTMASMFAGCSSLRTLDVSSFDTSLVTDMGGMFAGCDELITIYASSKFVTDKVAAGTSVFYYSRKLVGGNGTTYNYSDYSVAYARIDRTGAPGYFTEKFISLTSAYEPLSVTESDVEKIAEIAASETEATEPGEIGSSEQSPEESTEEEQPEDAILDEKETEESTPEETVDSAETTEETPEGGAIA